MPSLAAWYDARRAARTSAPHPGRDSLIEYCKHTIQGYATPPHIVEIAQHLEAVERRALDRLMIIEPPRHGKSLLASQRFPAWFMARNPRAEMIHASYGGELVQGFGRRVRNLMMNAGHTDVYPDSGLSKDSSAANLWATTEDGIYVAAGVGGPITGRGADLLLIDDPVKSREEADSEIMRNRVWDWYVNDAYTRLLPRGRIVLITTRWHEDDLAGRLLEAQKTGGDEWTVLHHPAVNADGEALWPERYPLPELDRIRKNIGARAWQALYQGTPAPATGLVFRAEWVLRGIAPPVPEMRRYIATDYARSESRGDYTVIMALGVDRADRLWVLDVWRRQAQPDKWTPALADMVTRWEPVMVLEEAGPIQKTVAGFIDKEMRERRIHVRREQLPSVVDKETRARGIEGRMAAKGLYIDHAAPFAESLIAELMAFPSAQHDDQVDCLSLIGRLGAALQGPREESKPKPPPGMISTMDLIKGRGPGLRRKR